MEHDGIPETDTFRTQRQHNVVVTSSLLMHYRPQGWWDLFLISRLSHPGLSLPGLQTWRFQKSPQDYLSALGSAEGEAQGAWEGPGLVSFDNGGSLSLSQPLAHHGHGIGTVC